MECPQEILVAQMLPNFPDEVLEQWLYEHWKAVIPRGWLGIRMLSIN